MKRWKQVKWTEAGQVAAVLGWAEFEDNDAAPEDFFDALRESGLDDEAVMFLGQALPRFEAVIWAARSVRDLCPGGTRPNQDALKSVFLWLQDPSDGRRRAAYDASSVVSEVSPQRLCALSAFFSGGSLGPGNTQPVPAPKDAAGKFAAGAVLMAATRSGKRAAGLKAALDLGDRLASGVESARP